MPTGGSQPPSFHEQMENLLVEQLKAHPRNHTARLKLLELYFEAGRAGPFMRVAEEMAAYTPDKAASPEWQKCLSMGRMLLPEAPLFSATGTDRIEFVGAGFSITPVEEKPQVRRLADDVRFVRHFEELAKAFEGVRADPQFQARLDLELTYLARRPSPLLHAQRLSQKLGGAQIYLKREDTSPRDTQLLVSVVGQALLAQRLGRKILVTPTIDGRRGVATASIAARLGLESVVFMDHDRNSRHTGNVFRMWLLGANVMPSTEERGEPLNAREAALKYWARNADRALMIFGLEGAPEPYPQMAREFAASIGRECLRQTRLHAKRPPDLVVTRGGDNSDALGLLPALVPEKQIRLVCVVPDGVAGAGGEPDPTKYALSAEKQRVAHGILEGMEYPSVVREQRWLRETGRVDYVKVPLETAKTAIRDLSYYEGIIPAIQTAHALGWACQAAAQMKPDQVVVVMVAEDVDKDMWDIGRLMGAPV